MSKELIVSATRHETKVAILEDDQLVELFFERENEYSLAGSIHKGRVTRVLPGMQSAFVDIGLERDAFLYVSDFFEDNEEYDKIVTGVEDKVLRLDKPAAAVVESEPAGEAPAAGSVDGDAAPPAATAEAAPAESTASQQGPPQPRQEGGDRDRRGRRSRRRRSRGRGLPDSKYASPGQASEPQGEAEAELEPDTEEEITAAVEEAADASDILILPGESLAKYRNTRPSETPAPAPVSADSSEDADDAAAPPVPEAVAVSAAERETGSEAAPEPEVAPEPVAAAPVVEASAPEPEPAPPAEAVAEAAVEASEAVVESSPVVENEPEVESEPVEGDAEADEPADGDLPEGEAESDSGAEGESGETADADGAEPARTPVSLTATLREQGGRYPRVSRRMRRRNRGGGGGQAATGEEREKKPGDAPAEARPQGRPEPRGDAKPVERAAPRVERPAAPSISDLLHEGQEIIVQIAKEPLGQKGARITSHIALPGRFVVYMPTVDHLGVSRKIASDEERQRLKRVLQAQHAGIPGGFIVRTAGQNQTEEDLRADMMFLYNLWLDMRQRAEKRKAPMLVHHDLDVVQRILRDQLTATFKNIWVDNEETFENILSFVQRFQPALVPRVKLYTRPTPIFDAFNVTAEIEKALRPKVWLKSGGYIVINQTEALVAIDINTGKYVGKSNRLEDTIVKTNTDAIKEIVRQIRLRDLGGIIVVDFIDMDERKNRQKVMQALEEAMRVDRAPYKILQFNDFGLVAITRKRVKQSLERTLCTPCAYCEGAGYLKSPLTLVGEILQEAKKLKGVLEGRDAVLRVNPELAKLLKSNKNSYLQEIEETLGKNVVVKSDPLLHQEKFDLV